MALNSAPTEGVPVVPFSQLKSTFPVLKNPANRHRAVGFTHEQWQYAFTNTFSEEESRRLYERYAILRLRGDPVRQRARQRKARPSGDLVDYRNDDRAPLLFVSGSEDHIMPPKVQASNAKHSMSDTITEVRLYEGYAHLLPPRRAEEIADYVLDWALEHADSRRHRPITSAGRPSSSSSRGGGYSRTPLRRTRPDLQVRLGDVVAKVTGPAVAADELPPLDAVLLSHDHHGDNLDEAGRALLPVLPRSSPPSRGARRSAAPRGLEPWETTVLEAEGRPAIEVTATPGRHGLPFFHPIVGDVIGRAALGGAGPRRPLDSGRHRPLRRRARGGGAA